MKTLPLLGERYRLGPVVGTGGMGTVHRAWDERFDREVAIKLVRAGADDVEQERLRREARYLARLDHPGLVAVYDAGSDAGRHGDTVWFAMELVHGPDLRRVIADRGRLATADVLRVIRGAAGALGTLHDAGVLHRDLKPANVLLTADPDAGRWEVKLADLGIARLMRADALTMTGQVVGTAAYLSPEQVSGGEVGPASDVYSLGLLALEALTGRVAFPGPMMEAAAARLVRSPEVPGRLDPDWRRLLVGMTARRPEDRPTTAELLRLLPALPCSDEPLPDDGGTLLMPVDALLDGMPTEAMGPDSTRLPATARRGVDTGWRPALRRRRDPVRSRRRVLTAVALAVATGLAGGGAALLGVSTQGDDVHAAPARVAPVRTPEPRPTPSSHPTASARPTAPPTRTAPEPARQASRAAAVVAAPAAARRERAARWRRHAADDLRRLEQRLGRGLLGHVPTR